MHKLIVLIILALLTGCSPTPEPGAAATSAQHYRGRWLVLNYWAEWCKPCREEIPELNRLASQLADRVAVLGVNYDGVEGPELAAAEAAMGIEFATASQDLITELNIQQPMVLPTTYVFNTEGKLVRTLIGPQSYDSLSQVIDAPAGVEESHY